MTLAETRAFVTRFLHRLEPCRPLQPGDRVLDIGAAQGVTVIAFLDAGLDARGVTLGSRYRDQQGIAARTDIRAGDRLRDRRITPLRQQQL